MWPGISDTTRPTVGSIVGGRFARGAQTSETRWRSSIQTASGGPRLGSLGRRIGKGALARATSRVTGRPSPSADPGGPARREPMGLGEAAGDGLRVGDDDPTDWPGELDGDAGTIFSPGSPSPNAPASATRTSTAARARSAARRTGRTTRSPNGRTV